MQSTRMCVGALLSLGLLTGCSTGPVVIADRAALCEDWREIMISKSDKFGPPSGGMPSTGSQIEANNKSRPAWGCLPSKG